MSNENAIKSAIRRSLHFEINSGNIGYIDKSYYKFFIYNETLFLEVEIMDGKILSARNSESSSAAISLCVTKETDKNNYYFYISGTSSTTFNLDVEYSFGKFKLYSAQPEGFEPNDNRTIEAGESAYYGTLISDSSEIASTVNIQQLDLGQASTLTVQTIKLGNWNIQNANEENGDTINITYNKE